MPVEAQAKLSSVTRRKLQKDYNKGVTGDSYKFIIYHTNLGHTIQ